MIRKGDRFKAFYIRIPEKLIGFSNFYSSQRRYMQLSLHTTCVPLRKTMIDDHLLDELVAEIGALIIENQNLRRKIDAIRFEVDTLNERVASTDMTLEALMRNAAILRAALSESRSNAAQLSAEKAQQDSADSAQRKVDDSY